MYDSVLFNWSSCWLTAQKRQLPSDGVVPTIVYPSAIISSANACKLRSRRCSSSRSDAMLLAVASDRGDTTGPPPGLANVRQLRIHAGEDSISGIKHQDWSKYAEIKVGYKRTQSCKVSKYKLYKR